MENTRGIYPKALVISLFFVSFFLTAWSVFGQTASESSIPKPDLGKTGGSLEVSPAIVEVTLEKPDDEKRITFTYVNYSKQFLSIELYPIDFKQKDGVGAISFLGQESGSYNYSLSSYLSFEVKTLELAPGEKKDFTVTVKNRTDLTPGGHYAAVIAKVIPTDEIEAPTRVAPSLSSLILLRKVGGERFNLSLSEANFPQESVVFGYPRNTTLTFRNEGNIHLVPYGRIEIKDLFGRVVYKGVLNSSSFRVFPSSIRFIPVTLEEQTWQLPISINSMVIVGQDSLKKTSYVLRESFIYINPYFFGGLVLIGGMLIYKRLRRKR